MLETSKGDVTFIWDRGERHMLIIWDLNHINSTPLYPSSPAGKKIAQRAHFNPEFWRRFKEQQHPLAGQQDRWEYCCVDLLSKKSASSLSFSGLLAGEFLPVDPPLSSQYPSQPSGFSLTWTSFHGCSGPALFWRWKFLLWKCFTFWDLGEDRGGVPAKAWCLWLVG